MNSLQIATKYGFLPYRRFSKCCFKPHFSIRIEDTDIHIDSSPGKGFNLITHAHSDHYGIRNMDNASAVASIETAKILETVSGKKFRGTTFEIGESIKLGELKVKTYPTHHIHGSSAFYFPTLKLLITGDVKKWEDLPKCEVLVTEATYSLPSDVFEDEIDVLIQKAEEGCSFGAYPIGKAQRVAEILNNAKIEFRAERKIAKICEVLGIKIGSSGAEITTPSKLKNGYILTAQKFYRLPRIVISDHVDYRGILKMIMRCDAEHVIFYHGKPSNTLVKELERNGVTASTLGDIDLVL